MKKYQILSIFTVIVLIIMTTIPKESSASVRFKDVGSNYRAADEISYLVGLGIVNGTSAGYFFPDRKVTRAEAAAMIGRALGMNGTPSSTRFSDVGVNVFSSGYINQLTQKTIISGYQGNVFKPNNNINRGEAAILIARAFDLGSISKTGDAIYLLMKKGIAKGKSDGTFGEGESITRADIAVFIANAVKLVNPSASASRDISYIRTQTIVIDPGHGGDDPGALGYNMKEKDVVLDVSKQVESMFKNTPFNIRLTRSTDYFIKLSDRVALAQQYKGNVFVSVHANAFNGSTSGTETYYYSAATNPYSSDSELLAKKIQARMLDALQLRDRGTKEAGFYVIKYNTMPAALAELGFIDNSTDAQKLASRTYRTKAAKAIYLGILDYYEAKGIDVADYK